uniref:Protein deadlock n=1 Tax=Stomoxys calcitrans TaxID=35570 RepID=A0A1I8PY88_STOCA
MACKNDEINIERLLDHMLLFNPNLKDNTEKLPLIKAKLEEQIKAKAIVRLEVEPLFEPLCESVTNKIYRLQRLLENCQVKKDLQGENVSYIKCQKTFKSEVSFSDTSDDEALIIKKMRSLNAKNYGIQHQRRGHDNNTGELKDYIPLSLSKTPRKRKRSSKFISPIKSGQSRRDEHKKHKRSKSKKDNTVSTTTLQCEEDIVVEDTETRSFHITIPSLFKNAFHEFNISSLPKSRVIFDAKAQHAKQKMLQESTRSSQTCKKSNRKRKSISADFGASQREMDDEDFTQLINDVIGSCGNDEETRQAANALENINNDIIDNYNVLSSDHCPQIDFLGFENQKLGKHRHKSSKKHSKEKTLPKKRGRKSKKDTSFMSQPSQNSDLVEYFKNFAKDCTALPGSTTPAASSTMSQPLVSSTTQTFEFIDQQDTGYILLENGNTCQLVTTNSLTFDDTQIQSNNINVTTSYQDSPLNENTNLPVITEAQFRSLAQGTVIQQNSFGCSSSLSSTKMTISETTPRPAHNSSFEVLDLSLKSNMNAVNIAQKESNFMHNEDIPIELELSLDQSLLQADVPLDLSVRSTSFQNATTSSVLENLNDGFSTTQCIMVDDGQNDEFIRRLIETSDFDLGIDQLPEENGDNKSFKTALDMPLLEGMNENPNSVTQESNQALANDSTYASMTEDSSPHFNCSLGEDYYFADQSTKEIFNQLLDIGCSSKVVTIDTNNNNDKENCILLPSADASLSENSKPKTEIENAKNSSEPQKKPNTPPLGESDTTICKPSTPSDNNAGVQNAQRILRRRLTVAQRIETPASILLNKIVSLNGDKISITISNETENLNSKLETSKNSTHKNNPISVENKVCVNTKKDIQPIRSRENSRSTNRMKCAANDKSGDKNAKEANEVKQAPKNVAAIEEFENFSNKIDTVNKSYENRLLQDDVNMKKGKSICHQIEKEQSLCVDDIWLGETEFKKSSLDTSQMIKLCSYAGRPHSYKEPDKTETETNCTSAGKYAKKTYGKTNQKHSNTVKPSEYKKPQNESFSNECILEQNNSQACLKNYPLESKKIAAADSLSGADSFFISSSTKKLEINADNAYDLQNDIVEQSVDFTDENIIIDLCKPLNLKEPNIDNADNREGQQTGVQNTDTDNTPLLAEKVVFSIEKVKLNAESSDLEYNFLSDSDNGSQKSLNKSPCEEVGNMNNDFLEVELQPADLSIKRKSIEQSDNDSVVESSLSILAASDCLDECESHAYDLHVEDRWDNNAFQRNVEKGALFKITSISTIDREEFERGDEGSLIPQDQAMENDNTLSDEAGDCKNAGTLTTDKEELEPKNIRSTNRNGLEEKELLTEGHSTKPPDTEKDTTADNAMSLLEMESNLEENILNFEEDDEDLDELVLDTSSCYFSSPNEDRYVDSLPDEVDHNYRKTQEPTVTESPSDTHFIKPLPDIPKLPTLDKILNANEAKSATTDNILKNFKIPKLKVSTTKKVMKHNKGITMQPKLCLERIPPMSETTIKLKDFYAKLKPIKNTDTTKALPNALNLAKVTRTIKNEAPAALVTATAPLHLEQPLQTQPIFKCTFNNVPANLLTTHTMANSNNPVLVEQRCSFYGFYEMALVFGVTCLPHLENICPASNLCQKSHQFNDVEKVFTSLMAMSKSELNRAYSFVYNHSKLYKHFFVVFCNVYTRRSDRVKLLKLVNDCERYPEHGQFLTVLFEALVTCGISPMNACRLMLKRSRDRSQPIIDALVAIIMKSDWTLFLDYIESFIKDNNKYNFSIGVLEQMTPAILSSKQAQLKEIFCKCVQTLHCEEMPLLKCSPSLMKCLAMVAEEGNKYP